MANDNYAVSIGAAAATLVEAKAKKTRQRGRPRQVTITNAHASNTPYVGFDSSVTTSSGTPIDPGTYKVLLLDSDDEVYGIASGASTDIRVLVVHGKGNPA